MGGDWKRGVGMEGFTLAPLCSSSMAQFCPGAGAGGPAMASLSSRSTLGTSG